MADEELIDRLVTEASPENAHQEVMLRELLAGQAWLIRKCQEQGMTDEQIASVLGVNTEPVDGRPVPCPHEGDEEACDRCWASHEDAVPYCDSDEYRRIRRAQNERLDQVSNRRDGEDSDASEARGSSGEHPPE